MSLLLKEIKRINRNAADVLQKADLRTDSDIRSLTREDLQELFPGHENFKLRRTIFKTAHSQKPVDKLLKELKDFIPLASLNAALTDNGVLVDYLPILKDMRSQINNIQSFFDAHISFLEEPGTKQPHQNSATSGPVDGEFEVVASDTTDQPVPQTAQPFYPPQRPLPTLRYQTVVSGKTFVADLQLMEKVKSQVQDQVQFTEDKLDPMITFLFCPITSRLISDVDAAMMDVKDDKPVILVLMHHTHRVKFVPLTTWRQYPKVLLSVNVFYHETVSGLLTCHENNTAVSEIQKEILRQVIQRSDLANQNVQGSYTNPLKTWKLW